jgi:magnesium-transporting ATPase (P-type)
MKAYLSEATDVLEQNGSSPEGLSEQQARQRLEQFGKNKLKEEKKPR